jgi:uncharacterized protein YggU (UPF0235/DUF167 family)
MILKVQVKPNSSERRIVEFGDGRYLIYLKSEAENNKANIELINLLSKHLGVPVGRIKIKLGLSSRNKVLEVF